MLVSSVPLSETQAHGQRGVGHQRQALAGEVVDHRQDAETPATDERVRHEVRAPALVRTLRQRQRGPGQPISPSFCLQSPVAQMKYPVEAVENLLIVRDGDDGSLLLYGELAQEVHRPMRRFQAPKDLQSGRGKVSVFYAIDAARRWLDGE